MDTSFYLRGPVEVVQGQMLQRQQQIRRQRLVLAVARSVGVEVEHRQQI